jgi:ATP-binding cassette, subfamily B, bacterial
VDCSLFHKRSYHLSSPSAPTVVLDLQTTLSDNRLVGIWRLMKGYRLPYLGAAFAQTISSVSRTFTFLLLRFLIDDVLGKGRYDSILIAIALGFVGLAALDGLFSFTSGRLASMTAENITLRLRNFLFDHIQRLSYAYHAQTPTGDLIQRSTSDVDALRRFFSDQAINIWRIIVLFLVNFITLFELNSKLALISIVVLPFIFGISFYFFKKVSKVYEAYQEQEATLSTTLQENLTGIRVVKAFARQDYEIKKFEKENQEKYQRGKRLNRMHAIFWPITDTLCGMQILIGTFLGATMVIDNQITLGTYLAYVGLVGAIIFPIRNLGRLIVQMSTGLVSYHRVTEIIKQQREPLDEGDYHPGKNFEGEIEFKQVSFEYEKNNPVLKNVSFHCKPGQVVALLGSTGSGKTTLVNLLPRFYDVSGGAILCDGIDMRRYPRRFLRDQIGIVEQEPFLFSRTIRENITYGVNREVSDDEIVAAATVAAIHDVILSFPDGYRTLVGEKGVTLSGGQKQRVAIARTLLKNPRILILDDSTSSVDTETESVIHDALETLMQNRTTFIIAHRIQSIMRADLILVFDKGEVIQMGTHADLIKQEGMYRQIYEIQSRIDSEIEKEVSSVSL